MKCALTLFLLFAFLTNCDNKVDPTATTCVYPDNKLARTSEFIKDVPATITSVTYSGQQTSYEIRRAGTSAPLGSCNLPPTFQKDGLSVTVSGYLLTFPGMEYINLSPLPFEITDIKVRE